MNTAYLCLGGNIGDREKNLQDALLFIKSETGDIIRYSSIYETEAWGIEDQAAYLNCCILLHTKLSAPELMDQLLNIEKKLGRIRNNEQYSSRTVDIDILFFNDEVIETDHLNIPHPRLHLRKFVLVPLNDIAENHLHPVFKKTIHQLLLICTDDCSVKLYNEKRTD